MDENQVDPAGHGLVRGFGILGATALNMNAMIGIGPFITIPLIIGAMGGPQCMLGWLIGTALAICDGLVWSELSAAMPETGGTYRYLSEILRPTRLAGLAPFLFLWQFVLSGPLEVASGYIGFAQYVGYFWRHMSPLETRLVCLGVGLVVVALLYRRVTTVGRVTIALWIGVLVTMLSVIVSGLTHFHPALAFSFPPHAFAMSRQFVTGLGVAVGFAMYDFLGYYDICYVGGEVRMPDRVIPRSIVYSVLAVAALYAVTNLSIIGVVPWRQAMHSTYIAAQFFENLYGARAASAVTVLILWTAFASVFALLLGYSRILYAAAENGHFFPIFARLHPIGRFPHVSLLVLGAIAIVASMWPVDAVIAVMMTSRILIQFIGQIAALHYMRVRRPDIARPFRMWLYPLPSIVALAGWIYIFGASGAQPIWLGLVTLVVGIVAYAVWRRVAPAYNA